MRLPIYIFVFIISSTLIGADTNVVIGFERVGGHAEYARVTSTNYTQIQPNDKIIIKGETEIISPEYNTSLHISSDVGLNMWLDSRTTVKVHEFIKSEDGYVLSADVNGTLDVVSPMITENTTILIQTDQAELEIKSSDFSIIVDPMGKFTFVECYQGTISMTDSITLKTTVMKEGQYASVYGSDGEKNNVVRITSLADWVKAKRKARLSSSHYVKEISSSVPPKKSESSSSE